MSDVIARLNAALVGRYEIEREIGEGGMATVFLARDLKHGREVALKVLKPELAAVVGGDRFLAEIETTAKLQHPHILPLFDSGASGSFLFYVMPYVRGESLRERMGREPALTVDEAVRIAADLAEALDYAHREGVVHRDIKPANVLMVEGRPIIADFGISIAKDSSAAQRLTHTGLSLGTPHYMSPEQAAGDETVDGRADTYALGCVLYEMLTDEPPHEGRSAQAILASILSSDPAPVSSKRLDVPREVDHAVAKALERSPEDRFAEAGDFGRALRDARFRHRTAAGRKSPLWAGLAVVAVTAAVAVGIWSARSPAAVPPEARSVAVLPFDDLSEGGDQAYLVRGLAEEIRLALTRLPDLKVSERSWAFALHDENLETPVLADRLGVAHVLDGSVRRSGDQVRISAYLVDVATGEERWSGVFEQSIDDVFALQDSVATAVARSLDVALGSGAPGAGGGAPRLVERATVDPAAHQAYLRGRFLEYQSTRESLQEAITEYEAALARDSLYADAWAALAGATYELRLRWAGLDPAGLYRQSLLASERALDLDPSLVSAHTLRGRIHRERGEWEEAEEEFRIALDLDPDDAASRGALGFLYWMTGRVDEGVAEAEAAVRLNPVDRNTQYDLAWALGAAGRWEDAVEPTLRAIDLDPEWPLLWEMLAAVHAMSGSYDEAIAAQDEWARLRGLDVELNRRGVEAIVRYLQTGEVQRYDFPPESAVNLGTAIFQYALTGQGDRAIDLFDRMVDAGAVGPAARLHSWALKSLLGEHPRYQAALRRAGITW